MRLDFVINKYLLIWYILYEKFSEETENMKYHLKRKYEKEYKKTYNEKQEILTSSNDYLPDDDTLFNEIESTTLYKNIKKETNSYRINLCKTWCDSKNLYLKNLNKILKCEIGGYYKIDVIHPNFNILDVNLKNNIIIMGKELKKQEKDTLFIVLLYKILTKEIKNYKLNDKEIIDAVLELVVLNELFSKVTKKSRYSLGNSKNKKLKEKIYPYFLMYLGVGKLDLENRMKLDNIYFNIDEISYNYNFKLMDIFSFISYLIKHKEEILKVKTKDYIEML